MPKSETSNPNDGPSFQAPQHPPNWVAAVVCFLLGAMLIAALIDYKPEQSHYFKSGSSSAWVDGKWTVTTAPAPAPNMMGPAGSETARILFLSFGAATWLVPIFVLRLLYLAIRNSRQLTTPRSLTMLGCVFTAAALLAMFDRPASNYFPQGLGGLLGLLVFKSGLYPIIGNFGSGLLLGTIYICGMLFIFTRDIGKEIDKAVQNFKDWFAARSKKKAELAALLQKEKETKAKQKTAAAVVAANVAAPPAAAPSPVGPTGKKTFVPTPRAPLTLVR